MNLEIAPSGSPALTTIGRTAARCRIVVAAVLVFACGLGAARAEEPAATAAPPATPAPEAAPAPVAAPAPTPAPGPGVSAPPMATAKITYVTSGSAYVSAGKDDGLAVGDVIEVVRNGAVVVKLKVAFLSSHRASCTIEENAPLPVVGDVVRFRLPAGTAKPRGTAGGEAGPAPAGAGTGAGTGTAQGGAGAGAGSGTGALAPEAAGAGAAAGAAAAPGSEPTAAPGAEPTPGTAAAPPAGKETGGYAGSAGTGSWLRDTGLRGRIGVRYLAISDNTSSGTDFTQPGLDLRLDGTQIGGAPVDLAVDARAQRTYRTPADGTQVNDSRTRVYRMSMSWRPGPMRLTLGRQFSPSLSVVSLFDGVLAEYRPGRFGFGVMAGNEPDPVTYGTSSAVQEYGAFFEVASQPGTEDRWRFTTGAIGSYSHGQINREFVYLQGSFNNPIVSASVTQEVDVNRGWRKVAEGSSFSDTSTFAYIRVRPVPSFSFNAGYDDRRNVRLYRDFITPETEFDDAHREGVWAGADWRIHDRFYFGLNGRHSSGGTSGSADSYTLTGGVTNLPWAGLDAGLRATRYTSQFVDGTLYSLSVGTRLGERGHWEFHAGQRTDTDPGNFTPDRTINWEGVDFDVLLGRHWFGLLSYEKTTGGGEDNSQVYTGLSFRF